MKLLQFIKQFLKKKKVKNSAQSILSEELQDKLESVDWSFKDVLVGTVRTDEQFKYNFDCCCYYAPAKYISYSCFPIRYVALYEGDLRNSNGIRYYGKITDILKVKREEIPVSRNKNNEDELYYFFKIEKWNILKNPIEVKDTIGRAPVFTNMFLLKNCLFTYQLFCINSPSQFKLMYNLTSKSNFKYNVNKSYSVIVNEKRIVILNNITNTNEKIPVFEFREKPFETFRKIKEIVYKQPE